MKERKEIQEVTIGYEATDGRFFKTMDACKEYEASAKITLYNELKPNIIRESNYACDLLGTDFVADRPIWFIRVVDARVMEAFNTYVKLKCCDDNSNPIKPEHIGKIVVCVWCYDYENWSECRPFDEIIAEMNSKYSSIVNPQTEQK